jgi:hypothetical protein
MSEQWKHFNSFKDYKRSDLEHMTPYQKIEFLNQINEQRRRERERGEAQMRAQEATIKQPMYELSCSEIRYADHNIEETLGPWSTSPVDYRKHNPSETLKTKAFRNESVVTFENCEVVEVADAVEIEPRGPSWWERNRDEVKRFTKTVILPALIILTVGATLFTLMFLVDL